MKIKRIEVTVSKTLQVGRFEPSAVSLTAVADVDLDKEDLATSFKSLYKEVSGQAKIYIQNELTKHLALVKENNESRKEKGAL
jgi:hypothetical protein